MLPIWPVVPADSTYRRKAVPLVTGTPASETVTPAGLYEKTTRATGVVPEPPGTTATAPEAEAVAVPAVPAVASFCELPAGIEYAKLLALTPAMVTFVAAPFVSVNCTVPLIGADVGLTRKIWVVHPAPSAKCGMTTLPVPGVAVVSITGSVDIRK